MTHRDPVAVIVVDGDDDRATAPACRSTTSTRSASAASWADRLILMLQACVRDRHLLPPEQSIDVFFDEFMADDMAMVAKVYAKAAQPLPDTSLAAMADYMAAHPRGRHGTVVYEPDQFGLDLPDLRERTRFYTDRFPISLES